MTQTASPTTAPVHPRRRRRPPRRGGRARSSAATCRCACGPGTAPTPARGTPRSSCSAPPTPLRRLLWHPGELGAAQAYVTGELDVPEQDGWDLDSALTHAFAVGAERGLSGVRLSPRAVVDAIRTASGLGALGRPPAAPASQARIKGRLHSLARDRSSISHHYDLSNEFYSLILEPQMAYSLRLPRHARAPRSRTRSATSSTWSAPSSASSQGMRMLDVGCGWGSLSLHAAEHFGAQVDGRDDRGGAEEVHRRPDRRARAGGPGRDPAPGLPRGPRARPLRRRLLARDGRARRRSGTTRPTSRSCAARCGPADAC